MKDTKISPDHTGRSEDPEWFFLAAFPLSEWTTDYDSKNELAARRLGQTVRELGMPPECVESMEITLKGFTEEARMQAIPGRFGLPGIIRIFCQKQIFGNLYPQKSVGPDQSDFGIEPAQTIERSGPKLSGGWGYFLVERSAVSACPSAGLSHVIDLYLYKEGE